MLKLRVATAAVVVQSFFLGSVGHGADVSEFIDFSVPGLPGRLYVPPMPVPQRAVSELDGGLLAPQEAHHSEPAPLIVFLHGAGETGDNNTSQVGPNIDNLFEAAKQRRAFLYAPQATTFNWSNMGRTTQVMEMVDQALASYEIDPLRIYVTGLSMGGGGTWNMLNRFSERFAAGVPIAAVPPVSDFDPQNLVKLPIWAFHARDDNAVDVRHSRNVVNSIRAAGGKSAVDFSIGDDRNATFELKDEELNLRYTDWPTGGHGIWGRVYADTELRDWMFAQVRAIPEPAAVVLLLTFIAAAASRRPCHGRFQD